MIAVLLLVVLPTYIIISTINIAVERHNKEVERQNMGEW